MALIYALTTAAKLKTYLDISASTWDTLLGDIIDEATDWIENYIGNRRLLCDTTKNGTPIEYTEYYNGTGKKILQLRKWPVISITSLSYATGDLNNPTWNALSAASEYKADPTTGEVFLSAAIPAGIQNIKVVYKGGYVGSGSNGVLIPAELELACLKLAAKEFNKRKSQGFTNESVGGASIAWNEDLDHGIKKILDRYKRLSF